MEGPRLHREQHDARDYRLGPCPGKASVPEWKSTISMLIQFENKEDCKQTLFLRVCLQSETITPFKRGDSFHSVPA